MNIEWIDRLSGLEALEPAWLELWRNCPRATPFQSPQWLLPWTQYLYRGGEIWALALRDNQQLVGFAPLFCWGTDRRSVSFLGAGISDYGDLLFAPGRESECASAVWRFLNAERPRWDVLDLQELRPESKLLAAGEAEACSICPVLELSDYPGTLDPKHRTDLHRARNKLFKNPDVQFTAATNASFAQHFDEFVRLHNARWSGLDGSLQCFHRQAAARFQATGNLRLSLLWLDGEAVAATYCFIAGRTLYCYLSGIDPAKSKLSPGTVLLGWVIDEAVAEGMREIDFLRKTEPYKYLWGARDRINYQLRGPSCPE
jgi:CelD/BcsL family acetyltransferase involved in cellulose biosynthesis